MGRINVTHTIFGELRAPKKIWLGYDKQGQFLEPYGLSEFFQRKKLYL